MAFILHYAIHSLLFFVEVTLLNVIVTLWQISETLKLDTKKAKPYFCHIIKIIFDESCVLP